MTYLPFHLPEWRITSIVLWNKRVHKSACDIICVLQSEPDSSRRPRSSEREDGTSCTRQREHKAWKRGCREGGCTRWCSDEKTLACEMIRPWVQISSLSSLGPYVSPACWKVAKRSLSIVMWCVHSYLWNPVTKSNGGLKVCGISIHRVLLYCAVKLLEAPSNTILIVSKKHLTDP